MQVIRNPHGSAGVRYMGNQRFEPAQQSKLLGLRMQASESILDAMEPHHPDSQQFKLLRSIMLDMSKWPANDSFDQRQKRYEDVIAAARQIH